MIDSTALVCITGQVYAHLLGTDAFQETDVINITTPVTITRSRMQRRSHPSLQKHFISPAAEGRDR
jgi:thiamine pyrophosphate-dependent acetolactate synthase large subunit-like protein